MALTKEQRAKAQIWLQEWQAQVADKDDISAFISTLDRDRAEIYAAVLAEQIDSGLVTVALRHLPENWPQSEIARNFCYWVRGGCKFRFIGQPPSPDDHKPFPSFNTTGIREITFDDED